MSDIENEFQESGSGASHTYPVQCSSLRKNRFVLIKGRPCKIVEMSTSKTGKHGSAKVHLVAIDIFTGKKCDDIASSTQNVDVPTVTRTEYTLLNIEKIKADEYLTLMLPTGETREDIKLPKDEVGEKIKQDFDDGKELIVTVLKAMGEEMVVSSKEAPKS